MLDWGVEVILWFQQFSPALDLPFKVFTFMGSEVFFMLLMPLFYWCLNRETGIRLTILFLFSAYLNSLAKALLGQPRPFQYDPRVQQLVRAGGGGLPSGHTQSAVVVWGYIAACLRRTWFWVVAVVLMVFIPLSRIYLGVHFPTDLLGGYVLGTVLFLIYLSLEPRVGAWLTQKGLALQLGMVLVVPGLLLLLLPTGARHGITAGAMMMGGGAGFVLESHWVGFSSGGAYWRQVLRFLLGSVVLFSLWLGLRVAFSGLEPEPFYRFFRYTILGLWVGLGAPWCFVKLRLARAR